MKQGERQVAPRRQEIRRDHVARYEWACGALGDAARVLDLGCGVGYGSQLIAQGGRDVLAVDRDCGALEYARRHYAHPRARYRRADAARLKGVGRFDAAVCFEMIEHIADPLPMLRALARIAPRLLASVPNEEVFPWRGYAHHYRHYTADELENLLAAAGWRVARWWGQEDDQADVRPDVIGRTIVVEAEHVPPKPAPRPIKLKSAPWPARSPEHVAILALGPSLSDYLELAKRWGGRRKLADEIWGVNALGDVLRCDRVFHMDDVRIQEIRAAARPEGNIAALLPWLRTHPGPVYTSRPHPGYPGLVAYPLEAVVRETGYAYMNGTGAYAVALAVAWRVKKISLFGFDFTYANSHHSEKGRACVEFWLGMAAARGIRISLPRRSSLMDGCEPERDRLYGYDTLDVKLDRGEDGRERVSFFERTGPLPGAEEIEARYDHTAHPNPLVRQ